MADEYLERYGRLTHDELHRQLLAGSPAGVDAVADAWHTVEDNVGLLAANLRGGLSTLLASWSGVGSEEYQRRLGLIATLADGLAREALAVRTGLGLMSAHLAEAQSRAEPDAGGPAEWAFDGVLGPALGRTLTTAQRSAAQQRMAQVVAGAALAYRLADHRHWPRTLPLVPTDLPGGEPEHHVLDHGHDRDRDDQHSRHAEDHDRHRDDHHDRLASLVLHAGQHPVIFGDHHPAPGHHPDLIDGHHHHPGPAAAGATAPGSTEPVRSVLAGAGASAGPAATAGLATAGAGATITGHLVGHGPLHAGGDGGDSTGSATMPPLGGAGVSPGPAGIGGSGGPSAGGAPTGFFRPVDTATSWSTGETMPWLEDDIDPPPPAVIGPTVH